MNTMIIVLIVCFRRTRGDLYKNITPDYYGYRDDDDGVLAQKEAKREVSESAQFLNIPP